MRKILLATLCVVLPAFIASCSNDSGGGQGTTGGSAVGTTSSNQGGSSAKSSSTNSTPSGGSSAPASSTANGGGSSGSGGSSGDSSTAVSTGGKTSTGGSESAGAGGAGSTSTGGTGTSGRSGGGGSTSTGGAGSTSTGGAGSTSTGGTGTAGSGGGGTASSGGGLPLKNDPVRSKGCGNRDGQKTLTTGGSSVDKGLPTSTRLKIKDREYIIDIPADYDLTHPYRLIFSWHQAYGSATGNANGQYPANNGPNFDAKNYAYFGLHREATAAKDPAIFVAPQGIGNFPWDYN